MSSSFICHLWCVFLTIQPQILCLQPQTCQPQILPVNPRSKKFSRSAQNLGLPKIYNTPLLCTYVGSSTFDLLCSLSSPDKPEDKTFDALITLLNNHFKIHRFPRAERHKFHLCKQKPNQSVSEYAAELKALGRTCEWQAAQLACNLGDRFVTGLANPKMIEKLLPLPITKTINELLVQAKLFETANEESQASVLVTNRSDTVRIKNEPIEPIAQISTSQNSANKVQNKFGECWSCGETNHLRAQCRFRKSKCDKCLS